MSDLESTLDRLAAGAPVDREDWDDVLARSQRSRAALVVLASVVALAAIVLATPTLGVGGRITNLFAGEPVSPRELSSKDLHALSAVTNHRGPPSSIVSSRDEDLAALGATVRKIAERDGRVYFVIERADGTRCYAVGSASKANRIGQIHCPISPAFPTAKQPILDESIFGGYDPSPGLSTPIDKLVVRRLEGFAADGVANVGIRVEGGNVEAVTEVTDNVYVRLTGLPTQPAREIVALDENGKVLHAQCVAKGGC